MITPMRAHPEAALKYYNAQHKTAQELTEMQTKYKLERTTLNTSILATTVLVLFGAKSHLL